MRRYGLRKAIEALSNKIDDHVGSNGDKAHLPADIDRAGFMAPDQVLDLNEALGNRTRLTEGTDILTLPAGHYWGINLVNSSFPSGNSGVVILDVTKFGNKYIQILEWESVYGRLKTRTIHANEDGTNYSAPQGWLSIPRYSTLWEGNVNTIGSTMTLTENITNFDKLIIYTDNHNGGVKGHIISRWSTISLTDTQNFNSQTIVDSYELGLSFDGKICKIENSTHYTINGGNIKNIETDKLAIVKIEGVR